MKVVSLPKDCPAPDIDDFFQDGIGIGIAIEKWHAAQDQHKVDLVQTLKDLGYSGKNTGRVLEMPVGDGAALYMLAEGPKSFLVHLPYGDAYHSPDVEFLPKSEVLRRIDSRDNIKAIFSKSSKVGAAT